ncbi:hypothetical protein [Rhizobium tropici]|uniref:Uncharacterized protein n=1 Tax=Rhizobium tropici TaxID=398 RepID=A0A329YA88_RHITR|nr:hypothetical protein [Rhizobium tropici]RAX37915.1 hypothetical protein DQ393_29995 [Rhizobium tropici]
MTVNSPLPRVLVYMPDQRGLQLACEALRIAHFDVTSAKDISDLERALQLSECDVIVTITAKIGEVRDICRLPIVNIQAFVLPNIDAEQPPPTFFDRSAFLDRVRRLHQDSPTSRQVASPVI